MQLSQKFKIKDTNKISKLQLLIIGRLMMIFLLVVGTWFWKSGDLTLATDELPGNLLVVFTLFSGLTVVYFFISRLNSNYEMQARVQFFLDAVFITWLIWRSEDLTSSYVTLYILLIAISSVYLSTRWTISISIFCSFLFVALVYKLISTSTGGLVENYRLLQIACLNVIALLIVGLLAGKLSERRIYYARLAATEKSLVDLRVLHERIVASIRSGLITTDLNGTVFTFNTAATEISGFEERDVIGKPISNIIRNINSKIPIALKSGELDELPPRFQTDIKTPVGIRVRIGYGISPLYDEKGEVSGLIITFQDLTEITRMEEKVMLNDRLAAVGRVAAGLAHEIRNPLGAMRGAIQVLQSQTPAESAQNSLMEIVLRESDRLNNIITNFLTYARPRKGELKKFNLVKYVDETFTLFRHSPDVTQAHQVICNLPAEPLWIEADMTQLKQVFWNVARNAIQAMPDGGTFKVQVEKTIDNFARIEFTDNGVGMSAEQVQQIFEPFFSKNEDGTGLGMSIVYQIISDHHGSINVKSAENKGTTLIIELPFRQTDDNTIHYSGEPPRDEGFQFTNQEYSDRIEYN